MAAKWRSSTWGDEISLEYGKSLRDYDKISGKFRVYGSNGPIGWTDKTLANGPGVILGRKGACRGTEYSRDPFFVIDTAYYVVPKNNFDMRWLYYAIKYHKLGEIDDGSPIPSTTRSAVYVCDLDIPSIQEQQQTASILGSLDDKIELNRKINETLDQLARAIFNSWFVDFEPVRAKANGRQPAGMDKSTASLFPDSFVDTELGVIPKGWKISTLGSALDILETGRRPKGGVSGYTSGIPSIGAESINGIGVFDYSKTKYIPHDFHKRMSSGHIAHQDVLLYKDGGRPGEFRPRVGMFGHDFPFREFCINEHVFRMRSAKLGQCFLYYLISDQRVLEDFANKGGKAAIPGINQADVKSTLFVEPPNDILSDFNRTISPICDKIIRNSLENKALADLRDTLLPKLLSGEITIPTIS